jgi:hypothetical protein
MVPKTTASANSANFAESSAMGPRQFVGRQTARTPHGNDLLNARVEPVLLSLPLQPLQPLQPLPGLRLGRVGSLPLRWPG